MKKLLILSTFTIILSSCSSDSKRQGCTDPSATNYSPSADYDNGTCNYIADAVFWYDALTANELNLYSDIIYGAIDKLDFYIENEYVGSEIPGQAFVYAGIPECYQQTYVTEQLLWGGNNSATVNVRVEGIHEALLADLVTVVDEFSFDIYANECTAVQIYFLTSKRNKLDQHSSSKPRSFLRKH